MDYRLFFEKYNIHPQILLPWNEPSPPRLHVDVERCIKASGGFPCKINYIDSEIDVKKLNNEVTYIANNLQPSNNSIAYDILEIGSQDKNSEICKIIEKVKVAISQAQGVLLPGGQDIQPLFYGQALDPRTAATDDFRRDVFELAILKEADAKNLPVFGICRGMQLANIWRGGTLHQHIDGHRGMVQKYASTENVINSKVDSIFAQSNNEISGDSWHHQAVDRLGQNLTVVSKSADGTVKALEEIGKRYFAFVQWHPETIKDWFPYFRGVSNNNIDLFIKFVEAAKEFEVGIIN